MDTSDPDITFDDRGECCYCAIYDRRNRTERFDGEAGAEKLKAAVAKMKEVGAGAEYDCIVGVSGGVDSTMVAYQTTKLGLRPLAVHLDNGWDSELAVDNITRVVETLHLDLLTHVIDWEEFRDLQLAFFRASVPNLEIPTDHAIIALLYQTALARGIKYILIGSNIQCEAYMPPAWGHDSRDLKHIRAIHARFGTRPLSTFPEFGVSRWLRAVLLSGVRAVPLLNYLDYKKGPAKQLISEELGWRDYGGKHYESIFTRFFQGYILPEKFGYDKRRVHLSNLVCAGEISRADAHAEMERPAYPDHLMQSDRAFVLKKFRLDEAEFQQLMALPPVRTEDLPSNIRLFRKMDGARGLFKRFAVGV